MLRFDIVNIETNHKPLATILGLCNAAWMHTMLKLTPYLRTVLA